MGNAKRASASRERAPSVKKKASVKKVPPKVKAPAKKAPPRAAKVTLASLAAQISALAAQVAALEALLRASGTAATAAAAAPASGETADFDSELLAVVRDLDRRGRHGGLVPIPDVRAAFVAEGWARAAFDRRLLEAEREFVVDLKVANDPSRLARPDLAIEETGRGHLQYVVAR